MFIVPCLQCTDVNMQNSTRQVGGRDTVTVPILTVSTCLGRQLYTVTGLPIDRGWGAFYSLKFTDLKVILVV